MLINPLTLIFNSQRQWRELSKASTAHLWSFIPYLLFMGLIPCVSWYYGTTNVGWTIGDGDLTKLTPQSAANIAFAMYIATLCSVFSIGYAVHWMAATYGASDSSVIKGVALTALTTTPFYLLGLTGLYPLFWIDFILGILGVCWSVYLLYTGIPIVMHIPKDRGFFFASALLAVSLVIFLILLGLTAILWDMGAIPVFAD
jgi:hypothetical protein